MESRHEAYDYVWTALNNAYPRVIWHKSHVMQFRDTISLILHNFQANSKGIFTLEEPTALDPRLNALKGNAQRLRINFPFRWFRFSLQT